MKNSNKILVIAVVLLLLVNIGMLIFMLKGKGRHERSKGRSGVAAMLIKELKMTKEQEVNYKRLKEEHVQNVRPLLDSIRSLKQSMFLLVKAENASDSVITSYSSRIADLQATTDKATINHFRTIRALFDAGQQMKFDSIMQDMMQKRKRPGGKDSANRQ